MATTNILGLFMSPEQYQAQQRVQDQSAALQYANMTPIQQANYGIFSGAQQLGRGVSGLLGVQDPQLQRIRQRQEIMQSVNPADPESLMAGIQRASQTGDQELALTLADYARKAEGDIALARQRQAQADRERVQSQSGGIQEAARINAITTELATLDPNNSDDKPKYDALVAERTRLERTAKAKSGDKLAQLQDLYDKRKEAVASFGADSEDVKIIDRLINSIAAEKGDKSFESIVKSERIGVLTDELETLKAENKKDTPEYRRKFAALKSLQGETGGKEVKELVLADTVVGLRKQIRDAKDPAAPEVLEAKDKLAVLEQQLKTANPDLKIVGEIRSGVDKGKTVFVDGVKDQQFVYSQNSKGEQVRKLVSDVDVDRLTSRVTATATSSGSLTEKTIVKGVAEIDVADFKTARDNKAAASASNKSLRKLLSLNDDGLISGSFASGRVGATSFLNTLGILSATSANNLARSEQYQKVGADLVFSALQGKLGPGVSEGDRKFITELFPKLENSAAARRELIKYLADKNNKIIEEADAVEDYIRKNPNKGLSGYKPKDSGVFYVPSNKIDLSTMSPQDLKALEQKLLRDKKGGGQ